MIEKEISFEGETGKYYVYKHNRLDKNEAFYIGIGTKPKYYTAFEYEYSRAFSKKGRNSIWNRIVNKTNYTIGIIFESDNKEEVKKKEIELIKLYGRIDLKSGILSNLTDGGDGNHNVIVSKETRIKRSLISKYLGLIPPSAKGLKRTQATKDKMSLSSLGKKKSKQHIENCRLNARTSIILLDTLTGVYYNNITELCSLYNIPRNNMIRFLKNTIKTKSKTVPENFKKIKIV